MENPMQKKIMIDVIGYLILLLLHYNMHFFFLLILICIQIVIIEIFLNMFVHI
jgi:hypothetical protein